MPKTRPPYSSEFRGQMVELARAGRSAEDEFADYETWDKGNLAGTVAKERWMLKYEYARSNAISGPVDPLTRRQLN